MTRQTDSFGYANHAEVVRGIQAGDTAAMEELYRALRAFRPFLCRQLGPTEAEDAAQDVFLIVYKAAVRQGGIRDANALMGFARMVVHRQVAKRITGMVRARRCCVNADDVTLRDPARSPERMAIDSQSADLAHRVLAGLAPKEREILLRTMQDQPNGQIVREMGLTETQFRNAKHCAKSKLADRFSRISLGSHFSMARKALQ